MESIEVTGGVGAFVAATGQVGEGESGDATSILANGHVATGQVGEVVSGDATTVRRCYVGGREVVLKGGGAAREQAEEELEHEFTRPATAASDDSRRPDQSKTSIYIYIYICIVYSFATKQFSAHTVSHKHVRRGVIRK